MGDILSFALLMQKQGYKQHSVTGTVSGLKGAEPTNPRRYDNEPLDSHSSSERIGLFG